MSKTFIIKAVLPLQKLFETRKKICYNYQFMSPFRRSSMMYKRQLGVGKLVQKKNEEDKKVFEKWLVFFPP